MATIYIQTTGSATNSGSTDQDAANLSGAAATVSTNVVSLDGSPDLSGIITSGPTQSSIYLNDATNSQQKIFWITAADDTAKTVTVSVAPTGITSSAWTIGGRLIWTQSALGNTLRPGDTIIINDDIASASGKTIDNLPVSGTGTGGFITIKGKTGVRPKITSTGNGQRVVEQSSADHYWFENLELINSGTGDNGGALVVNSNHNIFYNIKITDSGGAGFFNENGLNSYIKCEASGCALAGFKISNNHGNFVNCYSHDNVGDGFRYDSTPRANLINCIFESNTGFGVWFETSPGTIFLSALLHGLTVYNNAAGGISAAHVNNGHVLINSVLDSNGDAGGEYNFNWPTNAFELVGFHAHNVFYDGGAGDNLNNLTADAQVPSSEFTTNPALVDPANANFIPGVSGSAYGVASNPSATTTPGEGDIGAIQGLKVSPSGGGIAKHAGFGGGLVG